MIKFIPQKGCHIDGPSLRALMSRGSRYDTLTVCWKTYLSSTEVYYPEDSSFLNALAQKKYSEVTYKIRTLIMMAWKYDQHCLFRQLPKEIILEILSYEYIDEPPYWDVLHMVVETHKFPGRIFSSPRDEHLVKIFPLIWKNWDLPSYSLVKTNFILRMKAVCYRDLPPSVAETCLNWATRFLRRSTDLPTETRTSQLTQYCLLKESTTTLSLFKLMLEKNVIDRESLHRINYFQITTTSTFCPAIFLPFTTENKPMIELLIEHDLFVDRVGDTYSACSIEKYLRVYCPEKLHLLRYVDEYRAKKRAKKK